MRYVMLCLLTCCVLGVSFLGNAKSQPVQFADPLADEVKALKAEVKSHGDRLAELESAVVNLPFRTNSDPLQQPAKRLPAAGPPTTVSVQSVPTITALYGGRYSVCDGNGCRVVSDPGGLFRSPSVTTYGPSAGYVSYSGGGDCSGGSCGSVSFTNERRGIFGFRRR